jgi:hypothetical protein
MQDHLPRNALPIQSDMVQHLQHKPQYFIDKEVDNLIGEQGCKYLTRASMNKL